MMQDADMGTKVSLPWAPDSTRDGIFSQVDTSLASFFERPVVTKTYTWTPGQVSPFTAVFNPWTDFFGNPRVINRINNYAMMRAKLHVKFMINGNGFYYGRLMADYWPLPTNDYVTSAVTIINENAIQASQRMKVFIDPSTCCSNEMELPFVFYRDGVSIPTAEWSELGTIYVRELFGLKHANGSAQPITITVICWATNVEMSIPTSFDSTALVTQAGDHPKGKKDEYSNPGPVEATATAVASLAGSVSKIPFIGKYALATQMAAKLAAQGAKTMGWSRPALIDPHADMHPKFVSDLAPYNAGDNSAKLAVDIKQEVTVDPNVIGIDLPDEMSIASIAARESFLTPFPWTTAKIAGDILWTARVTPLIGVSASSVYYLPACAFASWPFQWWRGKMRYRFQIVASAYHKGRLRIVWDPVLVQSVEANVQFTKIVDISEERDITIEIDWGNPQHFLPAATSIGTVATSFRNTPEWTSASSQANGVISIYVLNDLATPNSTVNNDISVNVFVSCNDLQVAVPRLLPSLVNSYAATVQAGDSGMSEMVEEEASSGNEPGCGPGVAADTMAEDADASEDMVVYFGERITSFRQLLKRYNLHSSFLIANSSATIPAVWTPTFSDVPYFYGYNNLALHTTTAAGKFSYVSGTLLQYLMPAYVGMRGSQRSKYVVNTSQHGAAGSLTVARTNGSIGSVPAAVTSLSITSQSAYARLANPNRQDCLSGGATTIVASQPNLEVELPYYKPIRFDEARAVLQNATTIGYSSPFYNSHTVELTLSPGTTPVTVTRYTGVGEDFGLFWFQGCPPLRALVAPA
jgi:hypothetical protein